MFQKKIVLSCCVFTLLLQACTHSTNKADSDYLNDFWGGVKEVGNSVYKAGGDVVDAGSSLFEDNDQPVRITPYPVYEQDVIAQANRLGTNDIGKVTKNTHNSINNNQKPLQLHKPKPALQKTVQQTKNPSVPKMASKTDVQSQTLQKQTQIATAIPTKTENTKSTPKPDDMAKPIKDITALSTPAVETIKLQQTKPVVTPSTPLQPLATIEPKNTLSNKPIENNVEKQTIPKTQEQPAKIEDKNNTKSLQENTKTSNTIVAKTQMLADQKKEDLENPLLKGRSQCEKEAYVFSEKAKNISDVLQWYIKYESCSRELPSETNYFIPYALANGWDLQEGRLLNKDKKFSDFVIEHLQTTQNITGINHLDRKLRMANCASVEKTVCENIKTTLRKRIQQFTDEKR